MFMLWPDNYVFLLFFFKGVSSVNSFNGEGSKKRPNPAVDDNPQKKIKIEHNKVSFLNSLSN